jgi:hypothetical protein
MLKEVVGREQKAQLNPHLSTLTDPLMALIDEDYLRISLRSEAFRISFEEPFRIVFGLALIGAVSWFLANGVTQFAILGLLVPVATGVMSAMGIEFLRRRYLFIVGPEGLTCYNFWGFQKTIPWGDMRHVCRFQLCGLNYLRIQADRQRSDIWLPLFVARYDLLLDLIGTHVDEHHPLLAQLRLAGE